MIHHKETGKAAFKSSHEVTVSRELSDEELSLVTGGNPIVAGIAGAIINGVSTWAGGGDAGEIIMSATAGFATGTFGTITFAAQGAAKVYYGAVTLASAAGGGWTISQIDQWQESNQFPC